MLTLPDCVTVCNPQDFENVRSAVPSECHAISKATGCVIFQELALKHDMYSKCACFLHVWSWNSYQNVAVHRINGYNYSPQHFFLYCVCIQIYMTFMKVAEWFEPSSHQLINFMNISFAKCPCFKVTDVPVQCTTFTEIQDKNFSHNSSSENVGLTLKLFAQWNVFHVVVFLKIEDCEGKRFTCRVILPLGKYSRRDYVCLQNKVLKQSV